MNLVISPLIISRFIIVASIAIVIKIAMLALVYYLPHAGVSSVPSAEDSFYYKYKVSKAFGLVKAQKLSSKSTTTSTDLSASGPVHQMKFSGKLKAIYATAIDPFIAVEVKSKVKLIGIKDVLEGHTLIEVHPEYAVFVKNAKKYSLRFKENKNSKMSFSAATPEEIADVDAAVFVKRKEIDFYAKNLNQIWKSIKIKEQIKNKRLQGFKVTWIKKGSIFDKLGLKKDDLITGVNNKKFKSISQVFKLYNNMQKMDNLKLTIMRGNEEKELEYEIL